MRTFRRGLKRSRLWEVPYSPVRFRLRYASCVEIPYERRISMSQYSNAGSGGMGQPAAGPDTSFGTEGVGQLNSLLRGEISAAETYRMAIDKIADSTTTVAN